MLLCVAAALFEGFDNQSMGVAAPKLIPEFGLSAVQSSWVFSAVTVGLFVGAFWSVIIVGIVLYRAGDVVPPLIVAAAFLPATAWVVWFAWMFFAPLRTRTRVGVLALTLAGMLPFLLLFSVEGFTGYIIAW